jgi:hypothetical protein
MIAEAVFGNATGAILLSRIDAAKIQFLSQRSWLQHKGSPTATIPKCVSLTDKTRS